MNHCPIKSRPVFCTYLIDDLCERERAVVENRECELNYAHTKVKDAQGKCNTN
jgi:hypothetical protein